MLARSSFTMADQGLSSLFSLVAGVAAARAVSPEEFGLFAALFTTLLLARGVVKATALDPITIRHAGMKAWTQAPYAWAVTGATVSLGIGLSFAATALSPRMTMTTALGASAALATLLAVDTARMLDVASGQPERATLSSGVLLAGGVCVLGTSWGRAMGLPALLGLLAAAGAVALAVRRPPAKGRVTPRMLKDWAGEQVPLSGPLLLEYISNVGALLLATYLLAAIDLTEAGAMRAANMVSGPLYMLLTGIGQVVMTEASRPDAVRPATAGRRRRDAGITVAQRSLALSAIVTAAYFIVVLISRDDIGRALKITDPAHHATFTGVVVLAGLNIPSFVAAGLLRAARQARLLLGVRLLSLVPVVTATILGALNDGAAGVVRYNVWAESINLPLWTLVLAIGVRARRRGGGGLAPPDEGLVR